jgi:hypothetical protein
MDAVFFLATHLKTHFFSFFLLKEEALNRWGKGFIFSLYPLPLTLFPFLVIELLSWHKFPSLSAIASVRILTIFVGDGVPVHRR